MLLARPEVTEEHVDALAETLSSGRTQIDSGRVAEIAAQHRVAPLVGFQARRLDSAGIATGIDRMVIGLLEAAYRDAVRRNEVMAREMFQLTDAAAAEGLRVVVRKGGHLAYAVYPDPGMRPMSDLDLLIERSQAPRLAEIMTKLGYQEGTPTAGGIKPYGRKERIFWHLHGSDWPIMTKKLDSFDRPSVSVDINVSLALPKTGYSIPVETVMKRAVTQFYKGRPFLALDAEDTVIDLCAHIYKTSAALRFMHLGGKHRRLLKYLDVAEVIRVSGAGLAWDCVVERVMEYAVSAPAYFALAHLVMLYPGCVPQSYVDTLRALTPEPDVLLNQYGQWDLPEPLTWEDDFLTRFFARTAEQVLPPSTSLV